MACIITYNNKRYTQPEFNEYFKSHFFEFAGDFISQDIDGFKEWTKSLETFKIEPSESLIQQYVTARESAYIQRAQELADNIPGLYSQVLKDNTLSTLREIAEQVYGVPGTEVEDQEFQANSMFGEELVNIAKELYPKEDIIDNNINVIRKLSDLPDINLEGSNIKCS